MTELLNYRTIEQRADHMEDEAQKLLDKAKELRSSL